MKLFHPHEQLLCFDNSLSLPCLLIDKENEMWGKVVLQLSTVIYFIKIPRNSLLTPNQSSHSEWSTWLLVGAVDTHYGMSLDAAYGEGRGRGRGSGVWPSMVTHTRNLSSAFNPSKCTLTAVNTHPEQWAAMLRRPGSSWGIGALLKGLTSVVVLKVERALVIHSPHRH